MTDEMMCFAFAENKCTALKINKCRNCIFFNTKEQADKDQQKVFVRIKSLEPKMRTNAINLNYMRNMNLLDEVEGRK